MLQDEELLHMFEASGAVRAGHLDLSSALATGTSTLETMQVVEEAGGRVVAAGALIDRSGGKIEFPVEASALIDLPIASYEPDECPLCRDGSAPVKPGSRFVRSAP